MATSKDNEILIKKSFWLEKKTASQVEKEAKRKEVSESALMRHIISHWFKK